MNDRPNLFARADGREATLRPGRSGTRLMGRLGWLVLALLALALAAWLLTPARTTPPGGGRFGANQPMPVVAAPAHAGDMPITLTGLGTVTPLATVTVQSQISGQIMEIAFKEGQKVKAGDFLIQIDPRPYDVALEQAQGALARDQALLANAHVDLARYEKLFAEDSIAEQQVATQRALVAQDEGTVKTDQGQVDAAKLNLVYCHITSPVAGRVGLQQINLGNYVTPAEPNGLVVVTQLQPITVIFPLAEDSIPQVMKQLHAGATLEVTAYDRSHTTKLATGTVMAVDNQVDTSTGTFKVKATFPNEDESLFPNQFVNVDLLIETEHGATLVRQSAIQRGAPGTYVYVVNDDSTVSVRKVTLGPGNATDVAIAEGLKPGEMVVVDGADRLKDGAKVALPQNKGTAGAQEGQGRWNGQEQGQGQRHHRQQPDGTGGSQPSPQQ